MKRATAWVIGIFLVIAVFGAVEAVRRALTVPEEDTNAEDRETRQLIKTEVLNKLSANEVPNAWSKPEGMIGGINVTSDDLVGYGESNAYSDKSDAKAYSDIAWKIKNCSTITTADVNRAVNAAVSKVRLERLRTCTSTEEKAEAVKQATDEAVRQATITLTQKIKDEYCKLDCPAMKSLMMQYYDMNPVERGTRTAFDDPRVPTNVENNPNQCRYEFSYSGITSGGSGVSKVVTKLFNFTKGQNNCVWKVSGMTDP
jgi:hypothetical protein